jgi:hypothetical protein
MEGGSALIDASGERDGDTWTVTFSRSLAGGEGDITLESGKTYNFGFAIHDGHTSQGASITSRWATHSGSTPRR